jgi:8-oxo-dGTP pyrophosphatase MutT (NUDIX family)
MTNYVLGFAFDAYRERVALIVKNRPPWQKDHLNGIGGHIEDSDKNAHAAMVREFQEETGVLVPKWERYVVMSGSNFTVITYRAFGVTLDDLKTTTDEKVVIVKVNELFRWKVLTNLNWLIPLALDTEPSPHTVVRYSVP